MYFDFIQFFTFFWSDCVVGTNWQQFALKESNNMNKLCLMVNYLWFAVRWSRPWPRMSSLLFDMNMNSSVSAAGWVLQVVDWETQRLYKVCEMQRSTSQQSLLSNARLWRLGERNTTAPLMSCLGCWRSSSLRGEGWTAQDNPRAPPCTQPKSNLTLSSCTQRFSPDTILTSVHCGCVSLPVVNTSAAVC